MWLKEDGCTISVSQREKLKYGCCNKVVRGNISANSMVSKHWRVMINLSYVNG